MTSSLSVRHFVSITDIRRALKKITRQTAAEVAALSAQRPLLELAARGVLRQGAGRRIATKAADVASLDKKSRLVAALAEKQTILRHLDAQIRHEFPQGEHIVRKLQADVTALLDKINTTIQASMADSTTIEPDALPPRHAETATTLAAFLRRRLAGMYESADSRTLFTAGEGGFIYATYLRLRGLRDSTGYTYPEYYVVVSSAVEPGGQQADRLSIHTTFRVPEKIAAEYPFASAKEARKILTGCLRVHRLVKEQADA